MISHPRSEMLHTSLPRMRSEEHHDTIPTHTERIHTPTPKLHQPCQGDVKISFCYVLLLLYIYSLYSTSCYQRPRYML